MKKEKSRVAERLNELITEAGLNIKQLSERTGLEYFSLAKFFSGSRDRLSWDKITLICEFFGQSEKEISDLRDQYDIEIYGEEKCSQYKSFTEYMASTARTFNRAAGFASLVRPVADDLDGQTVYKGAVSVSNAVGKLLCMASEANAPVYINGYCEIVDYIDLIAGKLIAENPSFEIKHLIPLETGSQEGTSNNFRTLLRILPLILTCSNHYSSFYYTYSGGDGLFNPYPYCLIACGHALFITKDASFALLINDEDIVSDMQRRLEYEISAATPLCHAFVSTFDLIGFLRRYDNEEFPNAFFLFSPPMCLIVDSDIIERSMNKEFPGIDLIASALLDHYSLFRERVRTLKDKENYNMYLSLEGIDKLIETGVTDEWPSETYRPFSMEDRIRLISNLRTVIENGSFVKLLDTHKLRVPQRLSIFASYKKAVEIVVCDPLGQSAAFPYVVTIDELSMLNAFTNVFEYLPKSYLVLSREKALMELDERLARMKN